jgi:hypothetical protein
VNARVQGYYLATRHELLIWVNAASVTEIPDDALNEVETHFIKRLVHHLYLIMRRWALSGCQIIDK